MPLTPVVDVVLTHAVTVSGNASRAAVWATEAYWLTPLSVSAPAIAPVIHAGPFTSVPVFPLPVVSMATVPLPSSSGQYAMGPAGGGTAFVVKEKSPDVARLPAASRDL